MNLWTPLTILIGRKDAIEDVLESKNAIYVGLLFVISCGFAREYDQEYIFSDFLFFLLPLILSTILGFFCFCFCYIVYIKKDGRKNFWQQFRNFLSLFWMTAPIAFLYAIPVESLMDSLSPFGSSSITAYSLLR